MKTPAASLCPPPPGNVASFQTSEQSTHPGNPFAGRRLLTMSPTKQREGDQKDRSRRQGGLFKDRHNFKMIRTKSLSSKMIAFLQEGIFSSDQFILKILNFREPFRQGMYLGAVQSSKIGSFSSNYVVLLGSARQQTFMCLLEFWGGWLGKEPVNFLTL